MSVAASDDLKQVLESCPKELKQAIRESGVRTCVRIDDGFAQLHREMVWLKWMTGVGLAMVSAVFIRAFFFRGVV